MMRRAIRVGTRGSLLALRQTDEVIAHLARLHRDMRFEKVVIETPGEQRPNEPLHGLPGTGQFTSTLEDRLASGEIDLAVHSAKDLPTELAEGMVIASIPAREDPRDALIAGQGQRLEGLPEQSTIGTGSPRRIAQVLRARRDLRPVLIRGNLDTRFRKLEEGQVNALIVAAAGLNRMGWETTISEMLDPGIMMPAAGQGALAIEARAADREVVTVAAAIEHPESRFTVMAERAALARLAAGCRLPVGVLAVAEDNGLRVNGRLLSPDGSMEITIQVGGRQKDAEAVGRKLAKKLLKKGGREIIAAWNLCA